MVRPCCVVVLTNMLLLLGCVCVWVYVHMCMLLFQVNSFLRDIGNLFPCVIRISEREAE